MEKCIKSAALVALTVALVCCRIFAEPDAKQIMRQSNDAMKLTGSESITTLSVFDNKGNKRVRKFSSATKTDMRQSATKSVMRFLEPADVRGTGILIFDYDDKDADMWIYMPSLRKTRRIVSSEKTKSFMGSEFTNADITTPNLDDYAYKLIGSETIATLECWKIEITPVNTTIADASGYARKIVYIGTSDYVARRTEFFDPDNKLIKVLNVATVKTLDAKNKKYQATDILIENVQNGRSSRFVIDTIILNPNIKDDYFTPAYLEK
jgi:hypothetical protein